MNKNILAIAIAAAVAAPSAFAAATVYGVAHMGVASQDDGTDSEFNVFSNSSRLGIKGDEDLGSGLKALYQIEMAVGMDGEDKSGTGNMGASARNTFVGLGGGFGAVLMGRHDSPIKLVSRKYDLFGDQMGNSRNILDAGSKLIDGRHSNVLAYQSPKFGGFDALLAYVPGAAYENEQSSAQDNSKGDAYSAMLNFTAGAFDASVGYIGIATKTVGNDVTTRNVNEGLAKDFRAYRLAAGYTMGAFKVVGLYQNDNGAQALQAGDAVATGDSLEKYKGTRDTFGLGASYKVTTAGTIKAQYYTTGDAGSNKELNKTGASLWNVGYDHALSKNTTAYVNYALMDNEKNAGYSVNTSGMGSGDNITSTVKTHADGTTTAKDNSAFSVGIIHKF